MWKPLTGKLEQTTVDSAKAIAVKYNNGVTMIKTDTKDTLAWYDMSSVIAEYQIIN